MPLARSRKINIAYAALLFTAAAHSATAQNVITDNLSQTTASTTSFSSATWLAGSFQTDGSLYHFTGAVLLLRSPNSGTADVSLWSNTVDNQPGAQLVNLGTSATLTGTLSDIVYSYGGPQLLQPDTVYWIVANSTGNANWAWTHSTATTGNGSVPAGYAFGFSTDSGSTWTTEPNSNGPYQMQVTGTPITPEPGSLATLAGLGITGSLLRLRRRNRIVRR